MSSYLKKIQTIVNSLKREAGPQPNRDWAVLLSVTLLAFVALAGWSYYSFTEKVNSDAAATTAVSVPELKTSSLQDIQDLFAKRDAMRAQYQTPHQFVDPSL